MGSESMRISLIGEILIFCTLMFSIIVAILVLVLPWLMSYHVEYLWSAQMGTAWNLSTMGLSAFGMGLYLYGFSKHEEVPNTEAKVIFSLAFVLVLYGLFTCFFACVTVWAYGFLFDAITSLKGALSVITGFVLLARTLIRLEPLKYLVKVQD